MRYERVLERRPVLEMAIVNGCCGAESGEKEGGEELSVEFVELEEGVRATCGEAWPEQVTRRKRRS